MANLSNEMNRGARAEALLNDEILAESLQSIEQAILDRWAESPIADREGQHELRLMLKVCHDFKRNLQEVVRTGKLASLQHKQEAERKSRLKQFFRGAKSSPFI